MLNIPLVIPKSDVFLNMHGVEAGEPFETFGHVAQTSGVILQSFDLLNRKS
jgi:hypothetical protein